MYELWMVTENYKVAEAWMFSAHDAAAGYAIGSGPSMRLAALDAVRQIEGCGGKAKIPEWAVKWDDECDRAWANLPPKHKFFVGLIRQEA